NDRPRLAALRGRGHRRARPRCSASPPARAALRARTTRRARSRPDSARKRLCAGTSRRGTIGRMSHLDELDEYEAELELRIKKEYAAVCGLFRYCVLTQDASYLCTKYYLECMPREHYSSFRETLAGVWALANN